MRNKILVFAVMAVMILIVGCSKAPDSEQIKADLIGHEMGDMGKSWKFDSLSEFKELAIKNKMQQGDIIEYDINMRLKGVRSGGEVIVEALVEYKKVDGSWKIVSISMKRYEQVR
jgi:hypothetical protein